MFRSVYRACALGEVERFRVWQRLVIDRQPRGAQRGGRAVLGGNQRDLLNDDPGFQQWAESEGVADKACLFRFFQQEARSLRVRIRREIRLPADGPAWIPVQ